MSIRGTTFAWITFLDNFPSSSGGDFDLYEIITKTNVLQSLESRQTRQKQWRRKSKSDSNLLPRSYSVNDVWNSTSVSTLVRCVATDENTDKKVSGWFMMMKAYHSVTSTCNNSGSPIGSCPKFKSAMICAHSLAVVEQEMCLPEFLVRVGKKRNEPDSYLVQETTYHLKICRE